MDTNRRTAITVGILYIIGTVSGILSAVFTGSIFNDPDYLAQVAANQNQVVIGAILVLMMGLALAMVPVMMFPILKRHHQALALGYVVFRGALETATYMAMVISWLLLIVVSREYILAGAPNASYFQSLGALLKASDQINPVTEIVFSLGALMFYTVLYRSRLIPRWLSGWGLAGAALYLVEGVSAMFGLDWGFLFIPLALQEMVLAVWLIVKGFNPSAVATAE